MYKDNELYSLFSMDYERQQQSDFHRRIEKLYRRGGITRHQYMVARHNVHLEYGEFKLKVFEAVGMISHRQAQYARKHKEMVKNPYYLINVMRKEGRISREEAKELAKGTYQARAKEWNEVMDRGEAEKKASKKKGEKQKVKDRGRERERVRGK